MTRGSRSLLIVTTCLLGVAAAQDVPVTLMPQFYPTTNCVGKANLDARNWGTPAKQGGDVYPLALDALPDWGIGACMSQANKTFSLKILIDDTACLYNETSSQFVLHFYSQNTQCTGKPEITVMTLDACVEFQLGSVRMPSASLSTEDMCVITRYMSALATGGIRILEWTSNDCSGSPVLNQTNRWNQKLCANQPECNGCCRDWDTNQCLPRPSSAYEVSKIACKWTGSDARLAIKYWAYSDPQCTNEVNSVLKGILFEVGQCIPVGPLSVMMSIDAPMTVGILCDVADLTIRNSLSSQFVTWDELNLGFAAVPQYTLILAAMLLLLL